MNENPPDCQDCRMTGVILPDLHQDVDRSTKQPFTAIRSFHSFTVRTIGLSGGKEDARTTTGTRDDAKDIMCVNGK